MPNIGPSPKRRRGRPGADDSVNRRERIVAAAADEFSERGYDGATMRGIATRAEVDPALVHHYFGSKADLFGATVSAPMRPDLELPKILAGPREEVGASIVRYLLTALDDATTRKRAVMLVRAGIGNKLTSPLFATVLQREVLNTMVTTIEGPDAEVRASLVASQIAGLIVGRYILQLPGLATADVDTLVARVGPVLQGYLME